MRIFSLLGLICLSCSCSLPLRDLLLMHLVCLLLMGNMIILVSDIHYYPQLGNSSSFFLGA